MRKDRPNLTYEDLKEKLNYITDSKELELIEKAYLFAKDRHFGKKRLTGEDFVIHPLNVAYILTEIYADSATIAAALLHAVIEKEVATKEEVLEKFGQEVYSLVEGVTKINKLKFACDNEAVISSQRQILVGLCEDVRVIIILLADRLHNMRTFWVLPEKEAKEKAKETFDILTPIASRLGMSNIKGELEDLALRYYKPEVYFEIVENLNQTKAERDNLVVEMKTKVSEMLNKNNIKHEIKGRAKRIYSIYKKLDKGKKFSDIYDLYALRVYVDTEQDCYQVLGIIHSKYKPLPKRFKDYIAMPKANMYQSLHTTVFGIDGHPFEIQIRTYEMDKVAELGIASHWSYKEKGSNVKANMQSAMEQKLQFFRTIMDLKNEANDEEFIKSVNDEVLKDNIYVFTPKGDVVELPVGSTPIDFAYRVHSKVGDQMVGAIVNENIVPLDYELKNNDIIKINTNKNSSGPNREWINIAKTNGAKNKIKGFFNRIDKEEYLKKGESLLKEELRKRKIVINEFFSDNNINKLLSELKYSNLNELYANIGSNKITINQILNILNNQNKTREEIILNKATKGVVINTSAKNDIIVNGVDDIKVNIASCCKPIPGDRIVGYITKGNGITVHRAACPNVSDLEERIINVSWNENISKKYPTTILVHAHEGKNILLDIISKTSNTDISVQSINAINSSENSLYEITVVVPNKERLIKFMNEISSISNIIDVERLIK